MAIARRGHIQACPRACKPQKRVRSVRLGRFGGSGGNRCICWRGGL